MKMSRLVVPAFLLLPFCQAEDWTVNGKTFHHVAVNKIEPDVVHITYDGGIGSVELSDLTPELQKKYHYNPQAAAAAAQQKVEARVAAGADANTPSKPLRDSDIAGRTNNAPMTLDSNGLPILPPLNAPSLDQPTSEHGVMEKDDGSRPANLATELDKYKQYIYNVVGSYWYPEINEHFNLVPAGKVHLKFTIHSDGTVTDVVVLEGDRLELLKNISQQALMASAPFRPFSSSMIKQVGDSYADDFIFRVY